jgi:hypothetical protein
MRTAECDEQRREFIRGIEQIDVIISTELRVSKFSMELVSKRPTTRRNNQRPEEAILSLNVSDEADALTDS